MESQVDDTEWFTENAKTVLLENLPQDGGLVRIVTVWPTLSDELKNAIVKMISYRSKPIGLFYDQKFHNSIVSFYGKDSLFKFSRADCKTGFTEKIKTWFIIIVNSNDHVIDL